MKRGDSGGICCRGEAAEAVEEKKKRARDMAGIEAAARGTRAGRGSRGGILGGLCMRRADWHSELVVDYSILVTVRIIIIVGSCLVS